VYEARRLSDGLEGAAKVVAPMKRKKKKHPISVHACLLANESNLLPQVRPGNRYLPALLQDHVQENEWSMIVLERVPRGSLADLREVSTQCVFGIGWRLVKCLQLLHGAGIYHLDVKPSNILVADDPERGIVLVDFGISLPVRYTKFFPRKTAEGTHEFMGTHVWDLERESARDDLESAGLTMAWLLLRGVLPWSGDDEKEMRRQMQRAGMPAELPCDSLVLEEYLLRVRALGIDEKPDYEALLALLAGEAGDNVERLQWSY
jgi:serine/threonine protein kinase